MLSGCRPTAPKHSLVPSWVCIFGDEGLNFQVALYHSRWWWWGGGGACRVSATSSTSPCPPPSFLATFILPHLTSPLTSHPLPGHLPISPTQNSWPPWPDPSTSCLTSLLKLHLLLALTLGSTLLPPSLSKHSPHPFY